MNPVFAVSAALEFVCRLSGGQECDHCSWTALCETTSADTAACPRCANQIAAMLPDPRNVIATARARGEL